MKLLVASKWFLDLRDGDQELYPEGARDRKTKRKQ